MKRKKAQVVGLQFQFLFSSVAFVAAAALRTAAMVADLEDLSVKSQSYIALLAGFGIFAPDVILVVVYCTYEVHLIIAGLKRTDFTKMQLSIENNTYL